MAPPSLSTILSLLQTVFTSILEVFLLCLAGYILAARGILDKKTQKQLNRLNVSLFTPSLLFSKVAFFLSPAKLRELWIIPIFFVLVTLVSMSFAFLLGWIFRLKRSQRSFAMAAAMFMNSNSLPIALMQSLVVTVPGLKWGKDDNMDAMLGRALTYLVLYSTLGMVLRWSYGVRLLAQADTERPKNSEETRPLLSPQTEDETFSPLVESPRSLHLDTSMSSTTQIGDLVEGPINANEDDGDYRDSADAPNITIEDPDHLRVHPSLVRSRAGAVFYSFPNTPNQSHTRLPSYSSSATVTAPTPSPSDSDDDDDSSEQSGHLPTVRRRRRQQHQHHSSHSRSFLRRCRKRICTAWQQLNEFMTVPLWAALASLVVACTPPVQHTLDQHMQPIKGALSAAGSCSIPLTLVVLGAYFYPTKEEKPPQQIVDTRRSTGSLLVNVGKMLKKRRSRPRYGAVQVEEEEEKRPGETKTVIISVLSRMIITPFLLLPLMAVFTRYDLHTVFADPVFVVSNVLLISSPPAVTLAQITQAASGDAFERLISRTIFWAYCVVTPPSTIVYVVFGLIIAKL